MRTRYVILFSIMISTAAVPATAAGPKFACDTPLIDAAKIAKTDLAKRLMAEGFKEDPAGSGIYVREIIDLHYMHKKFKLEDEKPVPSVNSWMRQATIEGNHTVLENANTTISPKLGHRLVKVSVNLGYARPKQICEGMTVQRAEAALRFIKAKRAKDVGKLRQHRGYVLHAWILSSKTALVIEYKKRKLKPGEKPTLPLVANLIMGGKGSGLENWKDQKKRQLKKLAIEQPVDAKGSAVD
jgi:hypothetical protein